MDRDLLRAQGLTKAYDGKAILSGIDLTVPAGRCIAFIGHNGSGKSTLLKALCGLVSLTAGQVHCAPGVTFGYVPERFPRMEMTAAQYIDHMGRIEGLRSPAVKETAASLFADFFLEKLVDVPMKHLSKGTLQKVGVVQALLSRHAILLLDEPLSGQDIASQRVFVKKMERAKQDGCTLLLSCHEPFLVGRLADTVYEIQDGMLHPVLQTDARLVERDRLVFLAAAEMPLPSFPEGCAARVKDGTLVVEAPVDGSQAVLLSMLQQGYVLKEFYHESDL